MNQTEAVKKMLKTSGKSGYAVSKALGRSAPYIDSMIQRQKNGVGITVNTLALIAEETGYKVILEGHGETIEIDPPETNDMDK